MPHNKQNNNTKPPLLERIQKISLVHLNFLIVPWSLSPRSLFVWSTLYKYSYLRRLTDIIQPLLCRESPRGQHLQTDRKWKRLGISYECKIITISCTKLLGFISDTVNPTLHCYVNNREAIHQTIICINLKNQC